MMTDMFLLIDNSKVWKYAFALTGRRLSTHFIPRVSLRLPWAMRSLGFQPASFASVVSSSQALQMIILRPDGDAV